MYFKRRSNLCLKFCKLSLSTGLEQATQMLMNQCIIILKSVHRHEILHECKVAIVRATLHFQKFTKEQKQKRVDNGKEKVKNSCGTEPKTTTLPGRSELIARLRREKLVPMRVLRRTLTGTDDKFFIPLLNLALHRNSTTPGQVKSPTFHISKKMKFERS